MEDKKRIYVDGELAKVPLHDIASLSYRMLPGPDGGRRSRWLLPRTSDGRRTRTIVLTRRGPYYRARPANDLVTKERGCAATIQLSRRRAIRRYDGSVYSQAEQHHRRKDKTPFCRQERSGLTR